jgi:hypothetical protein
MAKETIQRLKEENKMTKATSEVCGPALPPAHPLVAVALGVQGMKGSQIGWYAPPCNSQDGLPPLAAAPPIVVAAVGPAVCGLPCVMCWPYDVDPCSLFPWFYQNPPPDFKGRLGGLLDSKLGGPGGSSKKVLRWTTTQDGESRWRARLVILDPKDVEVERGVSEAGQSNVASFLALHLLVTSFFCKRVWPRCHLIVKAALPRR